MRCLLVPAVFVACAVPSTARVCAEDPVPARRTYQARVVDADGRPIAQARAKVWWEARAGKGRRSQGLPLRNGVLSLETEDVDRKVESIRVFAPQDERGSPLNLAPVTVLKPFPGSATEVVIRMDKPGLVTDGIVVDGAGKGVADVGLIAYDDRASERDKPATSGSATTDAQGKFRIVGLGDGPYVLSIRPPPGFAPHGDVGTQGGESGIEIRLEPGVSPTLTVLDASGKPIVGAEVRAYPSRGPSPFRATTQADGRARLEGMIPDVAARLEIEPPQARRTELEAFRAEEWKPRDETFRLRAAQGR